MWSKASFSFITEEVKMEELIERIENLKIKECYPEFEEVIKNFLERWFNSNAVEEIQEKDSFSLAVIKSEEMMEKIKPIVNEVISEVEDEASKIIKSRQLDPGEKAGSKLGTAATLVAEVMSTSLGKGSTEEVYKDLKKVEKLLLEAITELE